jgi:ketosteroid isomerase-like protein
VGLIGSFAGIAGAAAQSAANPAAVPPAFLEMQHVEDRWGDAVMKRDQYGLELVLAPQFIGISASGDVTDRNQQIAQLFLKNSEPVSLQQKVVSVRFVGDVAIVNGTYVMTWEGEKAPLLEKGVFSHVFGRVRGSWLCLNSQRTVVAEETKGTANDKARGKHGSSSHLPAVYQGPGNQAPGSSPTMQPQKNLPPS